MRTINIGQKDPLISRAWRWFRTIQIAALLMFGLVSAISSAANSRLYPPTKDEAGALRAAQVVHVATREEILAFHDNLKPLLASGLQNSDLKDGSVAMGRVYCCHEATERANMTWFYVPPGVPVAIGDIVVVRMGHDSSKTDPGAVNTLTEIREKHDEPNAKCSWDPPNNTLWMRVLYCTWMPAEGWTQKGGLYKTWLKRPPDSKHR